jgi:Tfp pilus assembly protein PilO
MERINYPILFLVFFFLSISIIILFLQPKYQEIQDLKNAFSEWEKAFQAQKEYFKKLREDDEKLKDYQEYLDKIDSALPENPSPVSFFNHLWNLSQANGLFLESIGRFSISASKEIQGLNEIDTSFTLSGKYSDLKNFVYALERSARMIKIENISFKTPIKVLPGEEGTFDFSIGVKLYSL